MTKLCIYHRNCLDGFTSAYIFNKFHKQYRNFIEFHAVNYADKDIPNVKDKDVFILDFSYKRNILIEMAKQANSIVILDHHKTAQEDLDNLNLSNVEVIFDLNRSGAILTWDYFYPNEEAPLIIRHCQDYDLWLFKLENTKAIAVALYSIGFDIDFNDWDNIILDINKLIIEGQTLLRDKLKNCNQMVKHPQKLKILNYIIPAINCNPIFSSDVGNMLSLTAPFAATYCINQDFQVQFSLRSNKENTNWINVSEIAKQFSGGGHQCASGFSCSMAQLLEFING